MFSNKLFVYMELIKFYIFYFKVKVLKIKCYMTPEEFIKISNYNLQVNTDEYRGGITLENYDKDIILLIDKDIDKKYLYRNKVIFNIISNKNINFTIISTLQASYCVRFSCNFRGLNPSEIRSKNDKIVLISKDPSVISLWGNNLACLFITSFANEFHSKVNNNCFYSDICTNVEFGSNYEKPSSTFYNKELFTKFLNLLNKF